MSFRSYAKLWLATKQDLHNLILKDNAMKNVEPTRDRSKAFRIIANIYSHYILLRNSLSDILDQTLSVEKRIVLEKLLESASKRMLELQNELKKIEMSEYIYFDKTLLELRITPKDVEFLQNYHFPKTRPANIQNLINYLSVEQDYNNKEVFQASINLIKKHEKARQARKKINCHLMDREHLIVDHSAPKSPVLAHSFHHKEKVTNRIMTFDSCELYKGLDIFEITHCIVKYT